MRNIRDLDYELLREILNNCTSIQFYADKSFEKYNEIHDCLEQSPGKKFFCSPSYIVNIDEVSAVSRVFPTSVLDRVYIEVNRIGGKVYWEISGEDKNKLLLNILFE
jgi:hypothetical protein